MRRDEYLAALEAGLAEAAPDFVEEARRELSSHLDELSERHPELGEEELVARLTPPDLLAKALLEEFGARSGDGASARSGEGGEGGECGPGRSAGGERRTSRAGAEAEPSIEQEIEAELSRARSDAAEGGGEGPGFGEALRSYAGGAARKAQGASTVPRSGRGRPNPCPAVERRSGARGRGRRPARGRGGARAGGGR